MTYPVVCFGVSVNLVWLRAAHLLVFKVVFLFLENSMVGLAVELASFWVELGFSVGMETFFVGSYLLMFHGVRHSLIF